MKWTLFPAWNLTLALSRSTVDWWLDPRTGRAILHSKRSGENYEYRLTRFGLAIRKHWTELL